MNKLIRPFLLLAALATGSTALLAQPAIKLVTVDFRKAFDKYYKAEDANEKFNYALQLAKERAQEMEKQARTLDEELKGLVEQARSTLLNAEAKAKAEQAAMNKQEDRQRKLAELQDFVQKTQQQLNAQRQTRNEILSGEILGVVKDLALKQGATLVFDTSGRSDIGLTPLLYADKGFDITDAVITEVNKDRPVAPPAAPTPAPAKPAAATPAPAPGFTVPNVGPKPDPAKKP